MHTVALDSSGKVWTFGCNDEGALGRTTTEDTEEGTPRQVALPTRAVAICAGDSHSAALLHNGDVYAWGAFRDSHGSMGLIVRGREGKSSKSPVKIDIGETAVAIASGGDHLVMLSTSGAVYTMGCGEQGQLGRLSQRSASRDARQGLSALLVPTKVTLKAGASRVWAGNHATFVLDANSEKMFAWGLNNYGQLGITGEKRKTALYAPTECDAFSSQGSSWQAVAPGQHHSLALDTNGVVYAIGRCEYGRLGLGDRPGDAEVLELIPSLQNKKCISIAAGTSNSFAVTSEGEIVSWGMGSEGSLGTGQSADCTAPTAAVTPPLESRVPVHVSAGGQHTVLLVEDPNPKKEDTPPPESETADGITDNSQESQEGDEGPKSKRQKSEQEEEISSTSSAQPSVPAEESKPQKENGGEKKETPMEVDETDNTQEMEQKEETKSEGQTTETEQPASEVDQTQIEETKPETTDTSSQGTTDSEMKSQPQEDSQDSQKDVEMSAERTEINGTDNQIIEPKSIDVISGNPLTTTA